MLKALKRLASALLIAALISTSAFVMPTEAAGLAAPRNFRFIRWMNSEFTSCRIGWDLVQGANLYEVEIAFQNGSNKRYLQSTKSYMTITGLNSSQVYRARVYALKMSSSGSLLKYGNFSNTAYICPSPHSFSMYMPDRTKLRARINWNRITGTNGYNVFMTLNTSGKWYIHKQTSTASANSVLLDKYRGAKLKKYVNYYVKVVSRSLQGGRYATVPLPTKYYYYRFNFY